MAASTRPQVSSAVANDGVPACWSDDTITPSRVQAVDVDVRIDAALADQPQIGQALEQRRADLGALADQHQHLGVAQAPGQRVGVLEVVVPDGDVVADELVEAGQRADGVVIVVEDGDFHERGFRGIVAGVLGKAGVRYSTRDGHDESNTGTEVYGTPHA